MSKPSRKRKNPVYGPAMQARDEARAIFNRTIRPLVAAGKAPAGTYVWKDGQWQLQIG